MVQLLVVRFLERWLSVWSIESFLCFVFVVQAHRLVPTSLVYGVRNGLRSKLNDGQGGC